MKQFIQQRPLLFSVLVMLLLEAVVLAGVAVSKLMGVPILAIDLPLMVVNCIIAAVLLSLLGWWRAAGFNASSKWQDLHLLLLPLLLLVGPTLLLQPQLPEAGKLLPLIVIMLMIGFQEEAIFRGILLQALKPRGVMQAVLISALLFGIIHANSLLVGRDPLFVLSQIIASFLGAIGIAALRIRLNTIWPLVFMHALNDFLQFSATGGLEAEQVALYIPILKVAIASVIALYGLYLLRGEINPSMQRQMPSAAGSV